MRGSQSPDHKRDRLPFLARLSLGWAALAVVLAAAAVAAGGIFGFFWWLGWLHGSRFRNASTPLDVVKLVLAVVAGVGAAVGLVISYRRQLLAEDTDGREQDRAFNDRFSAAAQLLGSDQVGVRHAGVYSMERLADDWPEGRQKCVDVLCALARRLHPDAPRQPAELSVVQAWQDDRQFRHAILRVIAEHLRPQAPVRWAGLDFDLTGARIDGGDLEGVVLDSGRLILADATFASDRLVLKGARILGGGPGDSPIGRLDLRRSRFEGGELDLSEAVIDPGAVVNFSDAVFADGVVDLSGSTIDGTVYLCRAMVSGNDTSVRFSDSAINGLIDLRDVRMTGGELHFKRVAMEPDRLDLLGSSIDGGELLITPPGPQPPGTAPSSTAPSGPAPATTAPRSPR
ncbi:MAG: hypothetical protein HOW97_12400, partial [Catenulispora sp.]|nr:hypothetical protein [Catenulispora sp.]